MAEKHSRKRCFPEEDDDYKSREKILPPRKRVRFPTGKKVKMGDCAVDDVQNEQGRIRAQDAQLVAEERRRRRTQMAADLIDDEENRGWLSDVTKAEIQYEDEEETFEYDGIRLQPFNLTKEREEGYFDEEENYVKYVNENGEEGYFDEEGNYVEYGNESEMEEEDAWVDGIDANYRSYSAPRPVTKEDNAPDVSSEDIGNIKRRIADTLEPGETILRALRRLKGTSNNKKKEKMSAELQQLFDQLTDDATTLLKNGDCNVYEEKQETFQRGAEGNGENRAAASISSVFDLAKGDPGMNMSVATTDNYGDDPTDIMFEEDDPVTGGNDLDPSKYNEHRETGGEVQDQDDEYVYDDSSGYYYNRRLGCYNDPSSGLYCYAASRQWFSYNQESGTFEEVPQSACTVC